MTAAEIAPEYDAGSRRGPRTAALCVVGAPSATGPGGLRIPKAPRPVLSEREIEVLLAWLAADSKEEAADSLFISASTVSTHISRIRVKYASVGRPAPTKAHLLARALQDGYTTLAQW
ncbi:response regulator transcription factor [Gordonia sp. (in: high G+C Gram-positive bacteria)]|uniref:response regulator transcription factor n=1 Tax=Gordonia sp. (in: high G+C Gram-positive bacteria) TaxID=84139 RepID=UPI003528B1BC